jgi:hypothetical protein
MNIESNVNLLLDQLDKAVAEEDTVTVFKIGQAIEALLEQLTTDTIQVRTLQ